MTLNGDQSGFTRRHLLGLATLTTPGLAGASVGVAQAKTVPKAREQRPFLLFGHRRQKDKWRMGEAGQLVYSVGGVLVFIGHRDWLRLG